MRLFLLPLSASICKWEHIRSDPLGMGTVYWLNGMFCYAEERSHLSQGLVIILETDRLTVGLFGVTRRVVHISTIDVLLLVIADPHFFTLHTFLPYCRVQEDQFRKASGSLACIIIPTPSHKINLRGPKKGHLTDSNLSKWKEIHLWV